MAAAREHQGLQIALILFVFLTAILGFTTYYFFASYKEELAKIADYESGRTKAEANAAEHQDKQLKMRAFLGFAEDTPFDDIQAAYTTDVDRFNNVFPQQDGDLNYRLLVQYLADEVVAQDKEVATQKDLVKKAEDQLATRTAELDAVRTKFDTDFKQAKDDLDTRTTSISTQFAGHVKVSNDAQAQLAQVVATVSNKDKLALEKLTQVNNELKRVQQLYDTLKRKFEERDSVRYEEPDGAIVSIDQKSGIATIDLGSADNLKSRVTFSVYPYSVTNISTSQPKATIEVTNVRGDHMAEARITSDSLTDPILPGDKLFTPAWSPGQVLHFAFAGNIDLDGDNKSDIERIKSLVSTNGGVVDAWQSSTGEALGAINRDTRYLVQGQQPKDKVGQEAYSALIGKANEHKIEVLPVDKFLSLMGYRANRKTANGHQRKPARVAAVPTVSHQASQP